MSLVNDALKRARSTPPTKGSAASLAAQAGTAAVPALSLPDHVTGKSTQPEPKGLNMALGAVIGVVILGCVAGVAFFLFRAANQPPTNLSRKNPVINSSIMNGDAATAQKAVEPIKSDPITQTPPPVTPSQSTPPPIPTLGNDAASGTTNETSEATQPPAPLEDRIANTKLLPVNPPAVAVADPPKPVAPAAEHAAPPASPKSALIDGAIYVRTFDLPGFTKLELQAIIASSDSAVALINGSTVSIGDDLGSGITLMAIEGKRIQLRAQDKRFYIRMP